MGGAVVCAGGAVVCVGGAVVCVGGAVVCVGGAVVCVGGAVVGGAVWEGRLSVWGSLQQGRTRETEQLYFKKNTTRAR